ncbi:MHYT domain-containing protein [Paenibacillus sp. GYB003]|uniref:MHYT domain-containing protein n=1 Tax=Paenibacillus sp. GYB003 TaxID=2994392 RepID=UPI002F96AA4F
MEHAGGSYHISLVMLSVAVAAVASYTSLDMTSRARNSYGRGRYLWLSSSAVTMGLGIWSMHFIGMLAYRLPFPASYHLLLTFVSLLIAIGSSYIAIFLVSRNELSSGRFFTAGVFMGGGISAMHYTGMAAIQSDFAIRYKLFPFALSIAIAIFVSCWALFLTFRLQKKSIVDRAQPDKLTGSILLGLAVSGMHYVGMMATHFVPAPVEHSRFRLLDSLSLIDTTVAPNVLSYCVGVSMFVLIGCLVAGAHIDRKLAHESAQLRRLQFEALYNGTPDLICTLDLEGRIIQANDASERITGYAKDELLHRFGHPLLPHGRVGEPGSWFEQAKRGLPQNVEQLLVHKHGHPVNVSVTAIPVVHGKRVAAVMAIIKNITAQKQHEDMARKTDKLTIAGQLAAGVAHEIRNPLTTIKGFLHLLRRGIGRDDIYEVIDQEIAQIDTIITEFLLLAKHQPEQYRRIDLNELIRHVLTLVHPQANMNNIVIETRFDPHIPEIVCDENKIKQVFVNLLKNAIESMAAPGTVRLDIGKRGESEVVVRVEDEGGGLSDERMSRLGEPFYSTKEKGTGIGLMVSFKIINEHKGTIRYKNIEGAGTAVEVTLPVR